MEPNRVLLDTPNGRLRGSRQSSHLGYEYCAFKGVPYAKPPIGQLRFQAPRAVEPWSGILEATSHGPISAQYDHATRKVVGSEDCLYLNVYTRDSAASSPVMLYIHGGGFYYGSGDDRMFGPDFLLTRSVVLVTINYRLGVFGFFNAGDKVASGNQGLKDQVMALKWVKTNIAAFGGDPDNVTIFGGSVGAASVHFLTMSPMAKGLFHKAICQSGTAFSPISSAKEPDRRELLEFVESLGCEDEDPEAIVDHLRGVDFAKLIETQEARVTPRALLRGSFLFTPCIDDASEEPFAPTASLEAARRGVHVPLMIGWNEMEGITLLPVIRALDLQDMNLNLESYTFASDRGLLETHDLTFERLRRSYFKSSPLTADTLPNLLEFLGDVLLIYYVHELAKIQARDGSAPTYLYKLSYDKNPSLSKMQIKTDMRGANHSDELMYLFRASVYDAMDHEQLREDTGGERVMRQMVELWTNFAKTGRPTLETSDLLPVHWLPVANDSVLRYLNIDEELRMEKTLSVERRVASA